MNIWTIKQIQSVSLHYMFDNHLFLVDFWIATAVVIAFSLSLMIYYI